MSRCKRRKLGNVRETGRGFEIINFEDKYGVACSLQQSSLAEYESPGTSAVWLGCEKNRLPHLGNEMSPRMHLDRVQVACLIRHLKHWLDTGSFKIKAARDARESREE